LRPGAWAAALLHFAIAAQRAKEWPLKVVAMHGKGEIGPDALRCVGMNRKRITPTAFAHHAQRIITAVLVQVAHLQGRDFSAAKPGLQPDRQNRPVPQPFDGVFGGMIEDLRASAVENASVVPSRG
jgi:hypothetical protein